MTCTDKASNGSARYGVATVSRINSIIGLFCRISSLLQGSFAKETYNFIDPTSQSQPILDLLYTIGIQLIVAACCSVLQCVVVCYSVLQSVAVCCSVLQCVALLYTISIGLTLLTIFTSQIC